LPLLGQLGRAVTEDPNNRWALLAACQLWLYHLKQGQYDEADAIFKLLENHYRFEQLAALIPDELRGQILHAYRYAQSGLLLIRHDPNRSRILRRVLDVENLFQAPLDERLRTAHALCTRQLLNGEYDGAVRTAEEVLRNPDLPEHQTVGPVTDLV